MIEAVAAPMKGGSCSCHNGLVVHAAGPNMTRYPRRAMTILFMPDGSTVNGRKGYFSEDYFATKEIGEVLDDEGVTRLIYSASL